MIPQPPVAPFQWLAVLAIWGLVAYAALAAPRADGPRGPVRLIACR